jgi:predicted O-methyltransferase YrrM
MEKYRKILKGIKYKSLSRHKFGFGIHSPFVYEFVTGVMRNREKKPAFAEIEKLRKDLLKSEKTLQYHDPGAGSARLRDKNRKIKNIVKSSSVSGKYGSLLFRIVEEFKPKVILEIGTSLGISTLYLAKANKDARVYTLEGAEPLAEVALENFNKLKVQNVQLIPGLFKVTLAETLNEIKMADLVFFDGNHTKKATLEYFYKCLERAGDHAIFIFDDIHWSRGMEEAWDEIKRESKVRVTIDLFRMGLVFFRKGLYRQDFTIRY